MKGFVLLGVVALLLTGAAAIAAEPSGSGDMAERMRLSKDLHDIRHIRDRINDTIAGAAQALPAGDREDFAKYVQLHIDYDDLEKKSIDYAADIYTVPELKAMIAYFGSADGQSAEAKGQDYADKIGKDIMKDIDAAMVAAKYDGVGGADKTGEKPSSKLPSSTVSPDLLDVPKK